MPVANAALQGQRTRAFLGDFGSEANFWLPAAARSAGEGLRARSGGSFLPLLALVGGFQVFTGIVYAATASIESAATILQQRG